MAANKRVAGGVSLWKLIFIAFLFFSWFLATYFGLIGFKITGFFCYKTQTILSLSSSWKHKNASGWSWDNSHQLAASR